MPEIDWTKLEGLGLPRVGQLGFIVDDIPAALPAFAAIYDIKTWYRTHFTQNAVRFGERQYEAEWDFVTGYSGKLQVELIDLRGDEDNIFGPFLAGGGSGLQHLGFYLRDLDRTVARAEQAGMAVVQTATLRTKAGIKARVAFVDARPWCGLMLELIESRLGPVFMPPSRPVLELGVLLGDGEKVK